MWNDISMASYVIKKGTDVMATQYVSYTLQSSRDGQSFGVERRFSEFVLLQKELAKEFPAAIIAPLPKDQVFGRFKPSFIESRMRGLEEFLKKAYSDEEMSKSCLWNPFFSSITFNEMAVNDAKSVSGTGVTHRRSSWIDTVKNMAAVQLAKPNVETSEEDERMQVITDYVNAYTKGLKRITDASSSLANESVLEAKALTELSENSKLLGEKVLIARGVEQDPEATVFIQFGGALMSLAGQLTAKSQAEIIDVKEPIEQYSRTLLSMKAALKRQSEVKKAFVTASANHVLAEKDLAKEPHAMDKISKAEQTREILESSEKEFHETSAALVDNFEKVKQNRVYEIVHIAEALVSVELQCTKSSRDILADLLDDLS